MTVSALQKTINIGNAYLVRQELRYFDGPTNTFKPWTGPVTVRFCTRTQDPVTGVVTYTTISGMGPFSLVVATAGVWYYEVPTSVVALLNVVTYLGKLVYQLVEGGSASELQDVQPLLVVSDRSPL